MKNSFSIIIPTYNLSLEELQKNIESIIEYTYLPQCEIIIVSNGQSEEVNKYLLDNRQIKSLIFDKPLGYAKAINHGLRYARGEYIILLNDDVTLLPQPVNLWINILKEPFDIYTDAGITGPLIYHTDPSIHFINNEIFAVFCCVMIKSEVFTKIGLLDEGYEVGGCEDTDFCYRASKFGYKIYQVPLDNITTMDDKFIKGTFPIYHKGGSTIKTIPNIDEIYKKNEERFRKKITAFTNERACIGKTDIVRFWDRRRWEFLINKLKEFQKKYNKKPTVVEFGCGTGYGYGLIKEYVDKYIGFDYDENAIDFAKIDFGDSNSVFEVGEIHEVLKRLKESNAHPDFVICFETLEHLKDFRGVQESLLSLGKNILITVPYNEKPGTFGEFHLHHYIEEEDFIPGDLYHKDPKFYYQTDGGDIFDSPREQVRNLFVFWEYQPPPLKINAYIVTLGRQNTTLPLSLLSLINQNRKPNKITIIDQDDPEILKNSWIFRQLADLMINKGIEWEVINMPVKNQVIGHQYMNKFGGVGFDWLFRLDDDEFAEPDVLEKIEAWILANPYLKIGGIAPLCKVPSMADNSPSELNFYSLGVDDIDLPNLQWGKQIDEIVEVGHLHSCFLYRPNIIDYPAFLSPKGHREETIFSNNLKGKGFKLFVHRGVLVHHFRNPEGGIRNDK